MVTEVAQNLGVSAFTVRKWLTGDDEQLWPSRTVMFGRVQVYLYTQQDIERMRARLEERRTQAYTGKRVGGMGRPRTYSDEARIRRNRLQSRRYYWKLRYEEAVFNGDVTLINKAEKKIKEIDRDERKIHQ